MAVAFGGNNTAGAIDVATARVACSSPHGRLDFETETFVVEPFALQERATCENPNAGPDGAGFRADGAAYTLEARTVPQAVAFQQNVRNEVRLMNGDGSIAGALPAQAGMKQQNYLASALQVRRLTPTECERLQGFPDGWTAIPFRGKPAADGPRYKSLGNSMAVPVMSWVAKQIEIAESGLT